MWATPRSREHSQSSQEEPKQTTKMTSGSGFFKQLGLLMWKNMLLYIRRPCTLFFEIGFPIFFACIMLAIRVATSRDNVDSSTFYSSSNLHSGTLDPSNMEIGYVPDYVNTESVMSDVITKFNSFYGISATKKAFSTESALETYYTSNTGTLRLAVVFSGLTNTSTLPTSVTYQIRPATNDSQRWYTTRTYPFYQTNAPRSDTEGPDYISTGAAYLLSVVGESILRSWGGGSTPDIEMYAQRMPYPPYYEDDMIGVLQSTLPLFLMLSFILTVIQTSKSIVIEKERRIKESMKLMGLKPAAHWTSWFLTIFLYLVLALGMYAILFGVKVNSSSGAVLPNSDISLFYVFLLCYALAMITFCFMISAIAQKANVGAALAGIVFFGLYFPYMFVESDYEDLNQSEKVGLCLLFNMAMAFGANVIGRYEGTGAGAQWSNFSKAPTVDDKFSLLHAMLMLLFDAFLHLLITWYLDNVWPGEFGVPRPLYFCFTKNYWCGGKGSSDTSYDTSQTDELHFEKEPDNLKPGVQIFNLTKKFGRNKVAVDNMRLKMYEGQITVLLGHNGAGKTTTMSMITGFIPPTSGTALINDHDIRTDIVGVRKSLGLCPQHNILWDTLTVEEHLQFFAELKGSKSSEAKKEVAEMIKEVGLEAKKKTASSNLSGGQKRKLSVGIALISGSKVVVLDEPSSGMDPAARRQTWELLQRNRQGRTILLTTHYMDEADVLGDRIAIMSQGVVKCCGSSMFLKKLFGAGYHLVVVKNKDCRVNALTEAIQACIPSAQFEEEINAEVSYLLPDDQSAHFPDLFRSLEERKSALGIVGFGTSATTMEEVFLKVGENAEEDIADIGKGRPGTPKRPATREGFTNKAMEGDNGELLVNGKDEQKDPDNILAFNQNYSKLTGLRLQWSRYYGMFVKKVLLSWRHRIISIVQLLLPVVFTVLGLLVDSNSRNTETVLNFDLSAFGTTYVAYSNGSSPSSSTDSAATAYATYLSSQYLRDVDVASTYANMSTYLLTLATSLGVSTYNQEVIVGAQFDPPTGSGTLKATSFYNGQPYHALPIAIAATLNGLAQDTYGSSYSLTTSMYPLPKTEEGQAEDSSTTSSTVGFLTAFCLSFGMAFLTSSFVFFLVKEREVGAKHLQVVSGVGPGMFWLATLTWDYLNYLIPTMAMLIVFAAFDTNAYVHDNRLGLVLLVLLLYGWAALTFVYLISFMFKSPASAMVLLIIFNIITGLATTITVFILTLPSLNLASEAKIVNWVFLVLFPNYCMAKSFMDMYTNYVNIEICDKLSYTTTCPTLPSGPCCGSYGKCSDFCLEFDTDYTAWDNPGIGKYLLFMFLQGTIYMCIVLALELHLFDIVIAWFEGVGRSRKTSDGNSVPMSYINGVAISTDAMAEDSDVAEERKRINDQETGDSSRSDPLVLMNLCKRYGRFTAVDHICVGVPEQECFGLLGQNGAGKTTTFKMLTGDVSVTSGSAYLKNFDVVTQIKQVQQNMGYCPQFDALLDTMTGRETLRMYARLRGVPAYHIDTVVDNLINIMMLEPHKDKEAGFYSGGNKRKLSTAIALVGDPPFLLLDEPSSGVDPAARRQLWNVLSKVRASGRTLVLTSHSMEECDALCTRVAIMVNGSFKCLGSPQHLKNKFGQGYTLVVKMGLTENGLLAPNTPVVEVVKNSFPGSTVFDDMQGYVHFQVPDEAAHVADVFSLMERAKVELHVEDYSVHQTTLEQVFLTFTRKQAAPKDENNFSALESLCCCCCIHMGAYGKKKSQ